MGFKHERLGPRIVRAARSGEHLHDVHVFFGGTGAVGGTALLEMLSIYEEMFAISGATAGPEDGPVLLTTAATADELRGFEGRRLHRFLQSRGAPPPERVEAGLRTASGVTVGLARFGVTAVEGLAGMRGGSAGERRARAAGFLSGLGTSVDAPGDEVAAALEEAVAAARPFRTFLERAGAYYLEPRGLQRFRSVHVGIPIPSVVAYHGDELFAVAEHVPGLHTERIQRLTEVFLWALCSDLAEVEAEMADEVLVAHTTGVGGMYDEEVDDAGRVRRRIRLGFAHAALDRRLEEKARHADTVAELYRQAGLKTLVTAAAIGVDEVRVRDRIPLHAQIRRALAGAPSGLFRRAVTEHGRRRQRQEGVGTYVRTFRPLTVPFDDPDPEPVSFDPGEEIRPAYVIRSGENGFFTVANADALYRVMRVASASELGLVLARVGLLGDDPLRPWFPDGVCYYTETDNSRAVTDFLSQPALRATQLSGLEPMALQDLGSAKHQAELHSLALLILLHRLRTLDVDAIDPYVDPERFDPAAFFVERSRRLTFGDVATWDLEALAGDLAVLAGAEECEDLLGLLPARDLDLFPQRKEALFRVLDRVLRAVWTIPSLGTPILFERDGRTFARTGYYVAPLDALVTTGDGILRALREAHDASGNACAFEDFRDYQVAVGGFVDVRPQAIVCSAKGTEVDLTGSVVRCGSDEELRKALGALEPYSFFATAGLRALAFRLRAVAGLLHESLIELGTLQAWRWHMPRDASGHVLVVPGVVEALRMVSEGQEKTTGTERLDGIWGYERR